MLLERIKCPLEVDGDDLCPRLYFIDIFHRQGIESQGLGHSRKPQSGIGTADPSRRRGLQFRENSGSLILAWVTDSGFEIFTGRALEEIDDVLDV